MKLVLSARVVGTWAVCSACVIYNVLPEARQRDLVPESSSHFVSALLGVAYGCGMKRSLLPFKLINTGLREEAWGSPKTTQ